MKTEIFREGGRYRVKIAFASGPWKYSPSELLTFKSEGYSRYDEAQIFEFMDDAGRTKSWALFDRHPVDWREFFEPLSNPQ